MHFQLFRVKVYPPIQPSLFVGEFSPPLVLAETLRLRPERELRRGQKWHIGNLVQLDETGIYFALGRTTKSTIEFYDKTTRNFVEREFDSAPYTHVVCDMALEICGIARKSRLAPTTEGIARQLEKLLNSTVSGLGNHRFEVAMISDPSEFIQRLKSAYAVKRFALNFSLPNPFDVNEDFQKPMERLLRDAKGVSGKTALVGADLNPDVLVELTRSAAATGNQAEATIQPTEKARHERRRLAGDVATVVEEEPTTNDERRGVLHDIRNLYARIRGSLRT